MGKDFGQEELKDNSPGVRRREGEAERRHFEILLRRSQCNLQLFMPSHRSDCLMLE